MRTSFSQRNMDFTKRAHAVAQVQFYAPMFPDLAVEFVDTVGTVRDLEYAIDCQLAVTVPGLKAPLAFSVQERWRRPGDIQYGDVTITEWNRASDLPSELHKLGAQLFVYGFFDEPADSIVLAVAVDVVVVLRRLALRQLKWTRESRLDQTFLGFSYRDLDMIGAVIFKVDNRPDPRPVPTPTEPPRVTDDDEWADVVVHWPPDHPNYRPATAAAA